MAYIVKSHHEDLSAPASVTIQLREDALATALLMTEQGQVTVRIIGDGRIYSPAELSLIVGHPVSLQSH